LDRLPSNAKRFPATQEGVELAFDHLQKYHGIGKHLASERLHSIKSHFGYSGNVNVLIDRTGNVYDPVSLEWLGMLTEGGAK
jgi:hypothetical protein